MSALANETYLDLGGSLAACGLIFAAYQLRSPQWDLALRLRRGWQRALPLGLCVLGLLIIAVRTVAGRYSFFGVSPKALELAAYLAFIASPLTLISMAIRTRKLFVESHGWDFFYVMFAEVARSSPERLNAAAEVMLANCEAMCKSTFKSDGPAKEKPATAALNVILSDESMVKLLTTRRLDMLSDLFRIAEETKVSRQQVGIGIPHIVKGLYSDSESFLYRQLEFKGLALVSDICDEIFGSPILLTNFDLFGYPAVDIAPGWATTPGGVRVFVECLSRAIRTYLEAGGVPPLRINQGLSALSDLFGNACCEARRGSGRATNAHGSRHQEPAWHILNDVAAFLGQTYLYLTAAKHMDKHVATVEGKSIEANLSSGRCVNDGVAGAMYETLKHLSIIDESEDTYQTTITLLHGLLFERGRAMTAYGSAFEQKLWLGIAANVNHRIYPAILRQYLTGMAYLLASPPSGETGLVDETERMRRLLYVDLRPLFDSKERMINDKLMMEELLPTSISYEGGKFLYGRLPGKRTVIAEPPPGSVSALTGLSSPYVV